MLQSCNIEGGFRGINCSCGATEQRDQIWFTLYNKTGEFNEEENCICYFELLAHIYNCRLIG